MNKLEEATELVPVTKLNEAVTLATDLEFAQDALSEEEEAFASLCSPWDDTISALHEQVRSLANMREATPAVVAERARLALLEQRLADLKGELHGIALGLVDDKAFFPSGKKSQELTGRVTLKSQMPTVPVIADKFALVSAATQDKVLELVCKKLIVTLDGPVAIKWWQEREDKDVGLEAPEPKILNVKVKEAKGE